MKTIERLKMLNWTKKKKLALGIVILALVFIPFLLGRNNSTASEAIVIQPQKYTEKIVAAGQLQLSKETTLVSEVSGQIEHVGASVGDTISAGSVIISIDNSDQSFQLEQKKANYEDAAAQYQNLIESDYSSAKDALKSSESKKDQAKKSYDAAVSLFQEGAITQIDYMNYKTEYETALGEWNAAKLKAQTLGDGGSLRTSSYSKLQSAKAIYENALADQGKYQITAPWNSVLLKTYVNERDYVQPGSTLADVGEAGSYQIVTELDEKYFPYISKGMKAVISLGDNGKIGETEGSVDVITPKINEDTGTFEVRIGLPAKFPYLASDLTVNIEILLKERENAIVISDQYLVQNEDYVYLYKNGKAVKTAIKYEAGPSAKLLVTDGLKKGDIVIKPSASVQDGVSVKIQKGVEAS